MESSLPPMVPHCFPVPKSSTPRTLGTLSIIFGSIVTALSLFSVIGGKQLGAMMQTQPGQQEAFAEYMNEIATVSTLQNVVMLGMSIALIYLGIGQRKYMRWAASASVKWGVVALIYLLVILVVQAVVVLPAMERFMDAISQGHMKALPMGGIMKVSLFLGLAFYAPFPIILIAAFRKPRNLDAMDQPALPVATLHRS